MPVLPTNVPQRGASKWLNMDTVRFAHIVAQLQPQKSHISKLKRGREP